MFYHVKDLQFNARVSQPDPRFARVMLEAFGGANGELKSALQYLYRHSVAITPTLTNMTCSWILPLRSSAILKS